MEEKLRAKDIAYRYKIGLSTVWLYSKQGKLTPIKVTSGVTVFDIIEVRNLFEGKNKNI